MFNTLEDLEKFIATGKPIKYTYGIKYRHPRIYEVPISADKARELAEKEIFDVRECEDFIDFNCYSSNDLL